MHFQVALWGFLTGAAVGSYAGVVLQRWPRRMSSVRGRSSCLRCGRQLTVAELVPILSFLWLAGRCRGCRAAIPWQDLMAEICVAVAGAAAGLKWGWTGVIAACSLAVGFSAAWAAFRHGSARRQAGYTLVETGVAAALLAAVALPTIQFYIQSRGAQVSAYNRFRINNLAREKLDELQELALHSSDPLSSQTWQCADTVGRRDMEWQWTVEDHSSRLKKVTVEVRKNRCGETPSAEVTPIDEKLVALLRTR